MMYVIASCKTVTPMDCHRGDYACLLDILYAGRIRNTTLLTDSETRMDNLIPLICTINKIINNLSPCNANPIP